jgi:site-specific DNA-adenine methylase
MPVYSGGKAKIGKEIADEIVKLEQKLNWKNKEYFEPFCGMLGVASHFASQKRKVIANDINKDIILMWKKIKKGGWKLPDKCDKDTFMKLKYSTRHSAERGFYGVACTYSGIFYAGYRPGNKKQHFFHRSRNSIMEVSKHLPYIKFHSKNYTKFNPKNMTIYCDPPYLNNKFKSKYFDDFDSDLFWDTMRKWSKNNLVIISEYKAPSDFKCVWKKTMNSTFGNIASKRTEKLFILRD